MTSQAIAIGRPQADEHNPYYSRYIDLVPQSDVLGTLAQQIKATLAVLKGVSDEKANYSYAPDKWTVKEVVGHMIDTERVFAYRALRVARNDQTPMPGFEQDDYVRFGPFAKSRLSDLADEFSAVRQSNVLLLSQLDEQAWKRRGTANNSPISVRALAYIMAGHELHHRAILKEKYGL
jgi:hypothetical protein